VKLLTHGSWLAAAVLVSACAWSPKHGIKDAVDGERDWVHVINANSGRCLDVRGGQTQEGIELIQWGCHADSNMEWRFEPVGDSTFRLRNRKSRKCVAPEADSADEYVGLRQYECSDTESQQWRLEPVDEKTYRLVNAASGRCAAVHESSTDDWATIVQTESCDAAARWY